MGKWYPLLVYMRLTSFATSTIKLPLHIYNQLTEAMQLASEDVVAAMHRQGAGDVSILHDGDTCIARLPAFVIQSGDRQTEQPDLHHLEHC
jgi:hypothetical protein